MKKVIFTLILGFSLRGVALAQQTPPPECAPRLLVIEDLGQYSQPGGPWRRSIPVRGPAALTAVLLSLRTTCPSKGTPLRWPIIGCRHGLAPKQRCSCAGRG